MLSRDGPERPAAGPAGTDGTDGADGVPDGVLDDASFDTTTYEATLERTIGADVALDLSPIDTRIAALESATPPTPHTNRRYAALRTSWSHRSGLHGGKLSR